MKFLLKDENIAKFRKLPKSLWYLILAISFFARDSYSILEQGKATAQGYLESLGDANLLHLNSTFFIIMSCVFIPLFYSLFAELVMSFIYNTLSRRFVMAINREDFTFRTRITLILCNIVLAVIGISHYFAPNEISIISAVFNFAIPTLIFALFYEDFRKRYMPKKYHYSLMNYVAKIYLGVLVTFSAFSFIYYMLLTDMPKTTVDIIAYSVDLFIKMLFVGLASLYGKKLKAHSEKPEDNDLFIHKEEPKVDDNVFKDFNF